jgi:hypothetical protein
VRVRRWVVVWGRHDGELDQRKNSREARAAIATMLALEDMAGAYRVHQQHASERASSGVLA